MFNPSKKGAAFLLILMWFGLVSQSLAITPAEISDRLKVLNGKIDRANAELVTMRRSYDDLVAETNKTLEGINAIRQQRAELERKVKDAAARKAKLEAAIKQSTDVIA